MRIKLIILALLCVFISAQKHIGGELQEAALENRASDPATGNIEGQFYWNTGDKKIRVFNGTAYEAITSASPNAADGPASATDNAITRFDGATGKLFQNSSVTIDDTGRVDASQVVLSTSALAPSYNFDATDTDTYVHRGFDNEVWLNAGGNPILKAKPGNVEIAGTAYATLHAFTTADTDTYMYRGFNDEAWIKAGGDNTLKVKKDTITVDGNVELSNLLYWTGDADTWIYHPAEDQINIATNSQFTMTATPNDVTFFAGNAEKISVETAAVRLSTPLALWKIATSGTAPPCNAAEVGAMMYQTETIPNYPCHCSEHAASTYGWRKVSDNTSCF